MKKLLVIGGGLTGLSAAWHAKRAGAKVRLLEREARVGGVVQTVSENGWLVETGPNTMLVNTPETWAMLRELGLEKEIALPTPAAAKRFVVRRGELVPVPRGLWPFLTTPLLSARAKLRLLREPWAPARAADARDEESVADFTRRRLGAEAFDYLVNPFVAGVFAGDAEKLAVRHAFPKLHAMEREHGSLGAAGWTLARARKRGKTRSVSISFRDGMSALPRAFAAQIGDDSTTTGAQLKSLRKDANGWRAEWETTDGGARESFDGVVVAVPSHALDGVPLPAELRAQLAPVTAVEYPPVSVVALGFRREDAPRPLDGFGFLVPAAEPFHILGALFTSSLFKGRAPENHVLITAFVGGARWPEFARLRDEGLVNLARGDFEKLLEIHAAPLFTRVIRWPVAIPQYGLYHGAALAACEEAERAWPGLAVAGSHRGGVSVAQCLDGGRAAAERALNLASPTAN